MPLPVSKSNFVKFYIAYLLGLGLRRLCGNMVYRAIDAFVRLMMYPRWRKLKVHTCNGFEKIPQTILRPQLFFFNNKRYN